MKKKNDNDISCLNKSTKVLKFTNKYLNKKVLMIVDEPIKF